MYKKTQLKNGLRLITVPNKGTKAVTVLILLPVGSRYETKDIGGLSHFIEHMMFKGTERRPTTLDISKELDSIGAEYNAFTSKDYTGYYIKSSAEKLGLSFDILSDMLFHSTIKQEELDKERGVIVEEINMYEDNPLMHVESMFEELVFGDHPLGWQIAGTREVIKTVPREKMVSYLSHYYQPANMIIIVAGKIREKQVVQLTRAHFGKDGGKKFRKFFSYGQSQKSPRMKLVFKETEQVQLCLGFPGLSYFDKDIHALQLLSIILGGNMSSRLFVNIREKHGLCYFIRAAAELYHDTGTFVIQAGLDKSRIKDAIRLILEELKKVKKNGVTKKELQDAKDFLKGKMVLRLEDSESLADYFGKQELFFKKLETPEDKLKKYFRVRAKDILDAARKIIVQERLNLALIGPYKDKKEFIDLLKL